MPIISVPCPHCGLGFSTDTSVVRKFSEYWKHVDNCSKNPKNITKPPVSGYVYRKCPDGTFLVGFEGDIDDNHWHLAPDGTVLSVKEGGHHLFKRTDVTRNIRNVCPELEISFLWNG